MAPPRFVHLTERLFSVFFTVTGVLGMGATLHFMWFGEPTYAFYYLALSVGALSWVLLAYLLLVGYKAVVYGSVLTARDSKAALAAFSLNLVAFGAVVTAGWALQPGM